MPIGPRKCNGASCNKILDNLGDHWASCMLSGRVRRRAKPLERTWARIFREAGARVVENAYLRDMGLGLPASDNRRLEILATSTTLAGGIPIGVDSTCYSVLHADGSPWKDAATIPGIALKRADSSKATTYSILVDSPIVRLLTLACETGGRWSEDCVKTVATLAAARARSSPEHLQRQARLAFERRWWSLLSIAQEDALATTLVDDGIITLDGYDSSIPLVADVIQEEMCRE